MQSNNIKKHIISVDALKKLEKLNILLVGAGGIGCEIAKNLIKLSFASLTIMDYDLIEITNLNRQHFYKRQHKGLPKAKILAE